MFVFQGSSLHPSSVTRGRGSNRGGGAECYREYVQEELDSGRASSVRGLNPACGFGCAKDHKRRREEEEEEERRERKKKKK